MDAYSLHPLLQSALEIKSMKLGLERMLDLERCLGYPSRGFSSVHVAGTNGKGSVSTKIAKILEASGKKVGLYTSPHLGSYHERIKINSIPITNEKIDILLKKITLISREPLSYFELLTCCAFSYFAQEKIDIAVVETGLGGRLDATNIITPLLSIITSIDKDHTQYLGTTYTAIAREKAGIIKPKIPVLIGPNAKPAPLFKKSALSQFSPLFQVKGVFAHYELENQAIARAAMAQLPFCIDAQVMERAILEVPPCRFELLSLGEPIVILDVAHNPDGLRRTFERIAYQFGSRKVRVVAAFSADKDIATCVEILHKNAVGLHLTHTDHPRLMKIGNPDLASTFQEAYSIAQQNQEILLVCGTFFIMESVRILSKAMREPVVC